MGTWTPTHHCNWWCQYFLRQADCPWSLHRGRSHQTRHSRLGQSQEVSKSNWGNCSERLWSQQSRAGKADEVPRPEERPEDNVGAGGHLHHSSCGGSYRASQDESSKLPEVYPWNPLLWWSPALSNQGLYQYHQKSPIAHRTVTHSVEVSPGLGPSTV